MTDDTVTLKCSAAILMRADFAAKQVIPAREVALTYPTVLEIDWQRATISAISIDYASQE
jgi:hypothetical protein